MLHFVYLFVMFRQLFIDFEYVTRVLFCEYHLTRMKREIDN